VCDWASQIAGFLDQYNVAYDGKVVFCHATSGTGASLSYTLNDVSNNACLTHIGHLDDVFPTSICDS
jgi:hypothetical protein